MFYSNPAVNYTFINGVGASVKRKPDLSFSLTNSALVKCSRDFRFVSGELFKTFLMSVSERENPNAIYIYIYITNIYATAYLQSEISINRSMGTEMCGHR